MMFRIWCTVSGGVTGYRTTWFKRNGEVVEFATHKEAQAEADRMNEERSQSYVRYTYEVVEGE